MQANFFLPDSQNKFFKKKNTRRIINMFLSLVTMVTCYTALLKFYLPVGDSRTAGK
jgi:hypothetical protein